VRSVLLAFEPPDGGVAEQVVALAEGLGAHSWRVVVAGPPDAVTIARIQTAGLDFHPTGWARDYGHPAQDLAAARTLSKLLRRERFDVLHVHAAKAGALGRIVGARPRGPAVVYSPHCLPFVGDFGPLRRHGGALIERGLSLVTDRIVCVCEDERRAAAGAKIAERRLSVVLNGCSACPASVEPDGATVALAEGGLLVAAIAVLRRQKRLDVLVDATPSILERVPEARVAIIGDGPLRGELEAQARRLGLDREPRFALLPFNAPSARHLAALDLLVLPSAWEGLPIGVLEALACGVPVVATRVGGTPEAVTPDVGALVDPDDAGQLADATVALLRDPLRRAGMAAAAVKRHARIFGLEQMIAATSALYEEVVDSRS
jgi:glycosyltransferase involved in cell wall biosynthesis